MQHDEYSWGGSLLINQDHDWTDLVSGFWSTSPDRRLGLICKSWSSNLLKGSLSELLVIKFMFLVKLGPIRILKQFALFAIELGFVATCWQVQICNGTHFKKKTFRKRHRTVKQWNSDHCLAKSKILCEYEHHVRGC